MLLAPSQPHSPSFLPTRTSRRIVCPFFDLTGRVIVQPATESRNFQRHNHAHNVLRALHARPTSSHFPLGPLPLHAYCLCHHCTPFFLPARTSHPALNRHAPGSTWQRASSFNQPLNLDTSKVTTMYGMFGVRSPQHVACTRPRRRPSRARPTPRISPQFVLPPFDLAGGFDIQPAAESRHVQRHNHGGHVSCALPCTLLALPLAQAPSSPPADTSARIIRLSVCRFS